MCNLASSTDRELTKYEMESADITFESIESLLQTFSYDINECPFHLLKQLAYSYHNMILEFLSVNHNLQSELDLLKKTNADLIYKANMHHFKEVYSMTDNSDTPLTEHFGALYSLKTNAGGET